MLGLGTAPELGRLPRMRASAAAREARSGGKKRGAAATTRHTPQPALAGKNRDSIFNAGCTAKGNETPSPSLAQARPASTLSYR